MIYSDKGIARTIWSNHQAKSWEKVYGSKSQLMTLSAVKQPLNSVFFPVDRGCSFDFLLWNRDNFLEAWE